MSQRLRTVMLLVLFTLMASVGLFGLLQPTATKAAAGINNEINFEGRLFGSSGNIVADGTYSIQFKIYQDGAGTAPGDPGGTLLWTENDTVAVANGYFNVQLGAVTSLMGVNFSSDTLWLSLNVNSDGEMVPMKRLASDAYAFNTSGLATATGVITASQLGQIAANNVFNGVELFQNSSGTAFKIQNAAGTLTAFNADDSTGNITINGVLQSASGQILDLESGSSAAVTVGVSTNTTGVTIGHGTIGVTIPASSSLTLGSPFGSTTPEVGALRFYNQTNSNILTLQSGATASSFSLTLPMADGTTGQCLQTSGGSVGTLSFATCIGVPTGGLLSNSLNNLCTPSSIPPCTVAINTSLLPGVGGTVDLGAVSLPLRDLYISGSSSSPSSNNFEITGTATLGHEVMSLPDIAGTSTICVSTSGTYNCASPSLQGAYNNSTGGATPEILLDSTRGGLNIQDAVTSIGANLLNVRASAGSGLGARLFGVSNTGATVIQGSVSNSAVLQVNNSSAASVLTADTTNNRIGVDVVYSQMGSMGSITHGWTIFNGVLPTSTYYYKVTAVDSAGGETAASAEVSDSVTGPYAYESLSWTAVPQATSYKIYRSNTAMGGSGAEQYYASTNTNSFTDSAISTVGTITHTAYGIYGALAAGTYYYEITAVGANGAETPYSTEVSNTVTGSSSFIALSWPAVAGASGYRIYRGTAGSGSESFYGLINTNSFNDFGPGSPGTSIGTPGTITHTTSTTGGSLPTGVTYYYKVAATDSIGTRSGLSSEVSNTTGAGSTNSITLSWAASVGAPTSYNIYRSTVSGKEVLYDTIPSATSPQYVDTGTGFIAATPPSTSNAYIASSNVSNNNLQLTIGSGGTTSGSQATGQVYIAGSMPSTALSTIATGSSPKNVVTAGNYAYVANSGSNTIGVYDISSPSAPKLVHTFATDPSPSYLAVTGHYLYVTTFTATGTIEVFDISNPLTISTYISDLTSPIGYPYSIVISGRYAYIESFANQVMFFDISNPAELSYIGNTAAVGGYLGAMAVSGNYLYVLGPFFNQIFIYDISNPYVTGLSTTQVLNDETGRLGSAIGNTSAYSDYALTSFAVSGRYLYLTNQAESHTGTPDGIQVYDISNLASITQVAAITTLPQPHSITLSGQKAYVTTSTSPGYLLSFDVSNPDNVITLGSSTLGNAPIASVLSGRYDYILNNADGTLQIYDLGGTYAQNLEAGNAELGSLQVDTNESIVGNSSIAGGLTVGQSLVVQGALAVGGVLTPPNAPTFADPSTCSTTSIPGAIYYNSYSTSATSTNAIRLCELSPTGTATWSDLATAQDLGLLAYGILPNSGLNPGDLASITTTNVSGPCKVSWLSTTSVYIQPCTAYSGGRRIDVPAQSFTGLSLANRWYDLYLNPGHTGYVLSGGSATAETGTSNRVPFSKTAPLVQLADITTGASGTISGIYDTRVFTTDTKQYVDMRVANNIGWIVKSNTISGQSTATSAATNGNILGVIVASDTTPTPGIINAIIATSGPVFVKTNGTMSANQLVTPSSTTGYATTSSTANTTLYGNLGVAQIVSPTGVGACGAAKDCQFSELVNLKIR